MEMAKKMLAMEMDKNTIIRLTGLSEEDLAKL